MTGIWREIRQKEMVEKMDTSKVAGKGNEKGGKGGKADKKKGKKN